MNSHLLPLFISYRSSGEKLLKYQTNSSCVIMSVILMTTLVYKALILQGEIWYWSLLGLKGLTKMPSKRQSGAKKVTEAQRRESGGWKVRGSANIHLNFAFCAYPNFSRRYSIRNRRQHNGDLKTKKQYFWKFLFFFLTR